MDDNNIFYYIYTNFLYDNNILYEDSLSENKNNIVKSITANNEIDKNLDENNITCSESDYENLSKSLSDEIEEFDKKENKTYIRNNIQKKLNQNNNRTLILNESTDKGNTNNKDNLINNTIYKNNNKYNYNKNYITNIKNIKSLGKEILSNQNKSKNNSRYILLKIPSNDYVINILQNIHISTFHGWYKSIAYKYAKEKIFVKGIVTIIYNVINTCPQYNM